MTFQLYDTEEMSLYDLAIEHYSGYYSGVAVSRGICFLLAIIGISGNVMAYLTASRLGSSTSGTTFIKCLAVADTAAVAQDGIIEMGLPLFEIDLRILSRPVCKALAWFSWTTTLGGNFVLATFTLDRLCALYLPIQYRQNGKPWVAIVLALAMEAAAAAITWPNLFLFDINGKVCEIFNFDHFSETQMVLYANVAIFGFMFFAPFSCILVSNLMILAKLKNSGKEKSLSKKEREITIQLMTVSIAFLLTNLGVTICVYWTTIMTVDTPEQFALRDFVNFFKEVPAVTNNSMNFFLYVLSSHHFRTQFLRMVSGKQPVVSGNSSTRQ